MVKLQSNEAEFTLQQVSLLMEYLVQWLVRAGVGYNDFATILKPIFFQQAVQELQRIEQKPTDSAISLLSGLHRKDVSAFKSTLQDGKSLSEALVSEPVSVPARVIGLWIAEQLPVTLPLVSADRPSFESLVKRVSTEKHPRSILNELERLGIIETQDGVVSLRQQSFTPDTQQHDRKKLLIDNLQAHLAAGVHNIFDDPTSVYLEQAVFADELTAESIDILKDKGLQLWKELSLQVLQLAIERCALDEHKDDARHTFRLGIYQYDQEQ